MIKVVIRFSYGLNRTFALLSKSDMAVFSNNPLPHVDRVLKSLQAKKVIQMKLTGTRGLLKITFNKHYRDWRIDQTLRREPGYFAKVDQKIVNHLSMLESSHYQNGNLTYQNGNPEVTKVVTGTLPEWEVASYRNGNQNQDQDSDNIHESTAERHNKTYKDRDISAALLLQTTLPSLLETHPYFSSLCHEETFWNTLIAAYPRLDLPAEIRKMTAWLIANPDRKPEDYKRFIQAWLAREDRKENEHGTRRDNPEEKPAPFSDIPPELIA